MNFVAILVIPLLIATLPAEWINSIVPYHMTHMKITRSLVVRLPVPK